MTSKSPTDLLGRKGMAAQVVQQLLIEPAAESQVFGVLGDWGTGKTTFLQYLEESAKEVSPRAGTGPQVVHFNPWWFSGREDLYARFFLELSNTLGESESLGEVAVALRHFAKAVSATTSVLSLFGMVIPFAGSVVKATNAVADAIEPQNQSLDRVRESLIEALEVAEVPIWVFIDDVDRLEPPEMRAIFALVRSLGDLPYVKYFLAVSPSVISKSLQIDGQDYLDKIIERPIILPTPLPRRMGSIFTNRLQRVKGFDETAVLGSSGSYLKWFEMLGAHLPTVRQIDRLASSLEISYPSVLGEVHLGDFVLLEALKLFEPAVYSSLPSLYSRLTDTNDSRLMRLQIDDIQRQKRELLEEILTRANQGRTNAVSKILQEVFPVFKERDIFGSISDARISRRTQHPSSFFNYFSLALQDEMISKQAARDYWERLERDDESLGQEFENSIEHQQGEHFLGVLEELTYEALHGDVLHDSVLKLLTLAYSLADRLRTEDQSLALRDILVYRTYHLFGEMWIEAPNARSRLVHVLRDAKSPLTAAWALMLIVNSGLRDIGSELRTDLQQALKTTRKRAAESLTEIVRKNENLPAPMARTWQGLIGLQLNSISVPETLNNLSAQNASVLLRMLKSGSHDPEWMRSVVTTLGSDGLDVVAARTTQSKDQEDEIAALRQYLPSHDD